MKHNPYDQLLIDYSVVAFNMRLRIKLMKWNIYFISRAKIERFTHVSGIETRLYDHFYQIIHAGLNKSPADLFNDSEISELNKYHLK